jgi:hypothetical protein
VIKGKTIFEHFGQSKLGGEDWERMEQNSGKIVCKLIFDAEQYAFGSTRAQTERSVLQEKIN